MKEQIINNSVSTENFSKTYPTINKYISENGDYVMSRNGDTREILNFKTEIKNPYRRICGNNNRNLNVFFLLAEALWIFRGEKDVETLKIFNSRMSDYSDNGKVFHAPYGFRLRNYGVHSLDLPQNHTEENKHNISMLGFDQMLAGLKMLEKNPQDRRVVMSIWNPELDLDVNTKDIPCNDILMFKIRDRKLHTTIANRSNDLHWGLTTNVFQFSFMSEIMSNILDIQLGSQTHNSQSLHIYLENDIHSKMYDSIIFRNGEFLDLYDVCLSAFIDMNFTKKGAEQRLFEVDRYISLILNSIRLKTRISEEELLQLTEFSKYFALVYELLFLYIEYSNTEKSFETRSYFCDKILELIKENGQIDILVMAVNFFAVRMSEQERKDKFGSGYYGYF